MILIDNYDSFTYNLVQYFKEFGIKPKVFKNDEITIEELKKLDFSSIVISPGSGNPDGAGVSLDVIKNFYKTKKILGVCLGHQCIAQFFGANVVKAQEPMHGKVSKIYFEEGGNSEGKLFEGIEQGFQATRYHSLIVDNESLPDCLEPMAFCKKQNVGLESPTYIFNSPSKGEEINSPSRFTPDSSLIMALKHRNYPIYGLQFHPEAILTQSGKKLLNNFLKTN